MDCNEFQNRVSNWTMKHLVNIPLISELFLIGSTLDTSFEEIKDVDLVQKLNESNNEELLSYSAMIKELKKDFIMNFGRPLHITTFTSKEAISFNLFISKNKFIKLK
jgi:hypothetical protein